MKLHPQILEILNSSEVLEPETLGKFHPQIDDVNMNAIMAVAAVYKSRGFWENFYVFEDIVHALNNVIPNPKILEGTTPEQIWYALDLVHKIFPDREFTPEVLRYIEFMFNESGIYVYPEYLPLDNSYYDKVTSLAKHGPFPLGESTEEIQAAKYLTIQSYIELKKQE